MAILIAYWHILELWVLLHRTFILVLNLRWYRWKLHFAEAALEGFFARIVKTQLFVFWHHVQLLLVFVAELALSRDFRQLRASNLDQATLIDAALLLKLAPSCLHVHLSRNLLRPSFALAFVLLQFEATNHPTTLCARDLDRMLLHHVLSNCLIR